MAYDASFLTGSNSTPVDPVSTAFHHNEEEISDLRDGYTVLLKDGDELNLVTESFETANEYAVDLKRSCRQGVALDSTAYRLLNLDLNSLAKASKTPFDVLPAFESLDHSHPREITVAMENVVTQFIKDMWEKLKGMFLSVHKKIKDWYIKAWDGAIRLKKQAEALKTKAENMTNSTPRETTFDMGGVKTLHIGGKIPSSQDIAKGVGDINSATQVICKKNASEYDDLFPDLEKFLTEAINQAKTMKDSNLEKKPDGQATATTEAEAFGGGATDASGKTVVGTGKDNALLTHIKQIFEKAASAAGAKKAQITNDTRFPADNVKAWKGDIVFPGNIMLVYTEPANDITTTETYGAWKTGFKISAEPVLAQPKEIDDSGTFQVANTTTVVNICENVISACDVFVEYKLLWDKREKAVANLTKQMDNAAGSAANLGGVGQRHISNSISVTVACIKKMQEGESRWSKYAMTVLNKAIVYCRSSLNFY